MADKKIKGITIEIGGETVGLQKALQDVNKKSRELSSELKSVEKLLKFDPRNVEALAQKQKILTDQIENTSKKLSQLKDAQAQVEQQFQSGEIGEEQYRKFRREVEFTEVQLKKYQQELQNMQAEQQKTEESTRQLENLFKVTGKSVDDFADVLGNQLTNAIKSGRANSAQLEKAIDEIGKSALGANADLDKMRQALKQLDSGSSLKQVKKEFDQIAQAANDAKDDVKGFGDELKGMVGGIVAGGGLAGAINQALDTSRVNTQIDISFNVPEESKMAVKDAVNTIKAYGVDAAAALEGVRRQWALNKDATDEANKKIIEGAGMIAASYEGIDFTELIQEINEISSELNISNEEALGLTNALLKIGFPPEQLDIIAEYGQQLTRAGFSAQEVQSIMAAGVETGTWNIDNLLDGLKEGRIRIAELGQEVPKTLSELIEGTNISEKQLMLWGRAVAKGGKDGSRAMIEIAKALNGVQDETKKNLIGIQLFGTMYEDQGQNIIDTLLNMNGHMSNTAQNQEKLNESIDKLNSDPMTKLNKAFGNLKIALEPLLSVIASVVGAIASWMSANPQLAATITAIVGAIGIFSGVLMALAPILYSIQTALPIITKMLPLLGNAFKAMTGPIGLAITALTLLVPVIIENWEPIKDFFAKLWDGIKSIFETTVNAIGSFLSGAWEGIKTAIAAAWEGIKTAAQVVWDGIKVYFETVLNIYKTIFVTVWNTIKTAVVAIWNGLKGAATTTFEALKNSISTVWNTVKQLTSTVWNSIKSFVMTPVNAIRDAVPSAFETMKNKISSVWKGVKNVIKAPLNAVISMINSFIRRLNGLKIPDWVPGVGGKGINIPEIPMLARGTNFFKGGYAIVGEQGPELVQLPTGAKVYSNKQTQDMLSNQTIITGNTFVVREEADIKKIARELYVLQIQNTRGGGIA